jgi:hypothetical protein
MAADEELSTHRSKEKAKNGEYIPIEYYLTHCQEHHDRFESAVTASRNNLHVTNNQDDRTDDITSRELVEVLQNKGSLAGTAVECRFPDLSPEEERRIRVQIMRGIQVSMPPAEYYKYAEVCRNEGSPIPKGFQLLPNNYAYLHHIVTIPEYLLITRSTKQPLVLLNRQPALASFFSRIDQVDIIGYMQEIGLPLDQSIVYERRRQIKNLLTGSNGTDNILNRLSSDVLDSFLFNNAGYITPQIEMLNSLAGEILGNTSSRLNPMIRAMQENDRQYLELSTTVTPLRHALALGSYLDTEAFRSEAYDNYFSSDRPFQYYNSRHTKHGLNRGLAYMLFHRTGFRNDVSDMLGASTLEEITGKPRSTLNNMTNVLRRVMHNVLLLHPYHVRDKWLPESFIDRHKEIKELENVLREIFSYRYNQLLKEAHSPFTS